MSVAHYKTLLTELEANLTVSLLLDPNETPQKFRRKLSLVKTRYGKMAGRLDFHFEHLANLDEETETWSAVVVLLPEPAKPAPFKLTQTGGF